MSSVEIIRYRNVLDSSGTNVASGMAATVSNAYGQTATISNGIVSSNTMTFNLPASSSFNGSYFCAFGVFDNCLTVKVTKQGIDSNATNVSLGSTGYSNHATSSGYSSYWNAIWTRWTQVPPGARIFATNTVGATPQEASGAANGLVTSFIIPAGISKSACRTLTGQCIR